MITLRFNQLRRIVAKHDSTGTCGHAIKAGDAIGYGKASGRWSLAQTCCQQCFDKWAGEVATDDFDARMMGCE